MLDVAIGSLYNVAVGVCDEIGSIFKIELQMQRRSNKAVDKYYRLKGQKLLALFFVGCLLFNYPLLGLFSKEGLIFGIPVLYVYIFVSWAALIGLTATVIESRR